MVVSRPPAPAGEALPRFPNPTLSYDLPQNPAAFPGKAGARSEGCGEGGYGSCTHLMKYMRPLSVTVFGAKDQGGRWPQFTRDQRSLSGS